MAIVFVADNDAAQFLRDLRGQHVRQPSSSATAAGVVSFELWCKMLTHALFIPQHAADSLLVFSHNQGVLDHLRRLPAAASAWKMAQRGRTRYDAFSLSAASILADTGMPGRDATSFQLVQHNNELMCYLSDPSLVRSMWPSLKCSSPSCAFHLNSDEGALSCRWFEQTLPRIYGKQRPLLRSVLGERGALRVVVAATVAAVKEASAKTDFANGSDEDRYDVIRKVTRIVPSSQLQIPCNEIIRGQGAALIERHVVHQGGAAPASSVLVRLGKPVGRPQSCTADCFIAIFFGAFDAQVRRLYRENGNTLLQTMLDHTERSYTKGKIELLRLQVMFFARARLMDGAAVGDENWTDMSWLQEKVEQQLPSTKSAAFWDLPDPGSRLGVHHGEDIYWNALSRCASCPHKCPHASNFVWYCHCSGSPSHHGLLGCVGTPMGEELDFWNIDAFTLLSIMTGAHEAGVREEEFTALQYVLNAMLQPGRYIPVNQLEPNQQRPGQQGTANVVWKCPESGRNVSVLPLDPTRCPARGCSSELHINCLPTRLDAFPPVLRVRLDCNFADQRAEEAQASPDLARYLVNRMFADGKTWRPRIQEVLTLQTAGQSATYYLRAVVCHQPRTKRWFCPAIKDSGDGCFYSYDGMRPSLSAWIKLEGADSEELAICETSTDSISSIIYVRGTERDESDNGGKYGGGNGSGGGGGGSGGGGSSGDGGGGGGGGRSGRGRGSGGNEGGTDANRHGQKRPRDDQPHGEPGTRANTRSSSSGAPGGGTGTGGMSTVYGAHHCLLTPPTMPNTCTTNAQHPQPALSLPSAYHQPTLSLPSPCPHPTLSLSSAYPQPTPSLSPACCAPTLPPPYPHPTYPHHTMGEGT